MTESISTPLSHKQRLVLHAVRQEPRAGTHGLAVRVHGDAAELKRDLEACRCTLRSNRSAQRHIVETLNGPAMRFDEGADIDAALEVVDASTWGEANLEAELNRLAAVPIRIEEGPLARFHFLVLSPTSYVLLIVAHHIHADAQARILFLAQRATARAAIREGREVELPGAQSCFEDYLAWENELVESAEGERRLAYWTRRLGAAPELKLPIADRGARHEGMCLSPLQTLSTDDSAQWRLVMSRCGSTSYVGFLAIHALALFALTKQTEMVIGSPYSLRPLVGIFDLVNDLVDYLVLRVTLDPEMTFEDLIIDLERTKAEAVANYLPFEIILNALELDWGRDPVPLLQAITNFQPAIPNVPPFLLNRPSEKITIAGDEMLALAARTVPFERLDVGFLGSEYAGEIRWRLSHRREVFDANVMEALAQRTPEVVRRLINFPTAPLLEAMERIECL